MNARIILGLVRAFGLDIEIPAVLAEGILLFGIQSCCVYPEDEPLDSSWKTSPLWRRPGQWGLPEFSLYWRWLLWGSTFVRPQFKSYPDTSNHPDLANYFWWEEDPDEFYDEPVISNSLVTWWWSFLVFPILRPTFSYPVSTDLLLSGH